MRIAVLIPCFNEETTIGKVIAGFRETLPDAVIYVYDTIPPIERCSERVALGRRATSPQQGKGHVIRRMFADIEADIYVLVDGDDTYDPVAAPQLVTLLLEDKLDFVNAARVCDDAFPYCPGHRIGNAAFTNLVQFIFGRAFADILSGSRYCRAAL